jgi:thiamine-monophosphate kinase
MAIREFDVIEALERRFSKPAASVEIGIGDDAAVVASGGGRRWALTTDALVEGVHFELGRGTVRQLGRKALAVNLSDLAAMGAEPRHALVALGLPEATGEALVEELFDGLESMAREHRVSIIGGNLTRSPVLSITVTAVGDLAGPALARAGGSPGDRLVVTGPLGSSALGLAMLREGREPADTDEAALVERHLDPAPRVAVGQVLRLIARAGIDISDGLAQDAGHLARASRCGARLELALVPRSPAYDRLVAGLDDPWAPALSGGEDYELLLAVPPPLLRTAVKTAAEVGATLHDIGALVEGSGVTIVAPDGAERHAPPGWQHF